MTTEGKVRVLALRKPEPCGPIPLRLSSDPNSTSYSLIRYGISSDWHYYSIKKISVKSATGRSLRAGHIPGAEGLFKVETAWPACFSMGGQRVRQNATPDLP